MITRLDGASARRISAGQVITDLSSAVKELLENALDAGAHCVSVRLRRFGLDQIVIEDDGEGIPMPGVVDTGNGALLPSASTPLLRSRATTKRRREDEGEEGEGAGKWSEKDTANGRNSSSGREDPSLGFRGEALHSLAQMGNVVVETMHAVQAPYTVRLSYSSAAHEVQLSVHRSRQSLGTTVTVEDLFKQLPVRYKEFVKNQRKQLLSATNLLKQYAVSHPQLRLVFSHQENPQSALVTLVSLTGSNDLQRSVTEAYGGLCLSHMTRVEWHCSFGAVEGFVSKVNGGGRMAADRQVFSLDGRIVDLPRIAASINDAFGQCLPNANQRQSVAFFLRMTTSGSVGYDVNLAPNKRKVLIGHEEKLAEEIHAVALKEFHSASEGIDMERQAQRPLGSGGTGGGGKDASKEVRLPVSATAFTQYTFRGGGNSAGPSSSFLSTFAQDAKTSSNCASGGDGGGVGGSGPPPLIDLGKLGAALYNAEDDSLVDKGETESASVTPLSSLSTSGDSEDELVEEGNREEELEKDQRQSTASGHQGTPISTPSQRPQDGETAFANRSPEQQLVDGGEEVELKEDEEGELPVVRLSDQGNQKREGGARITVLFPSWERLAALGCDDGCACRCGNAAAATAETCQAQEFSNLFEQTGSELTAYFHKRSFKDMVVLGQFNHGFIIASLGSHLFVIDQHASDEKYNYERLMRAYTARPQPLVQPISVPMDAEEVELALAHTPDLLKHGFTVKQSGDPTKLLVSSVPVLPYDVVSATDVLELVQQLVRYGTITRQLRAVWHSLATKACRSSIMIGTALSDSSMRTVVRRLSELDQPWTCPHGRPTLRHLGDAQSFHMGEAKPLSFGDV